MVSARRAEELFTEALSAMKTYTGQDPDTEYEEYEDY